jgi:hypothetical protein
MGWTPLPMDGIVMCQAKFPTYSKTERGVRREV